MEERLLAGLESVPLGLVAPMPMLFKKPIVETSGESRPAQLLVLSAKTSSALDAATANLVEHLKQHPRINLAFLSSGSKDFQPSTDIGARDDAAIALETLAPQRVRTFHSLFPGQGRST